MAHWGVITWIGVLLLALVLLIYYQGASSDATSFASAFGTTAAALTGRQFISGQPTYAAASGSGSTTNVSL